MRDCFRYGSAKQVHPLELMPLKIISVFAIEFTKKTAGEYFDKLRPAGVKRIMDVRLNTAFQLDGISTHENLRYFLKKIPPADHVEVPLLAPPKAL
jgi:hypothetical protein